MLETTTQLGVFGVILEQPPVLLFRGVGKKHSVFVRCLPYRFIDPSTLTEIPCAQYYDQILFPNKASGNGCINAEYLALPEWKLKEVLSTQTARASSRRECIPQMGMMHRIFCSCRVSRFHECKSNTCVAFKETLRDLIPSCKSWTGIEQWALQVAACICSKRMKAGALASSPELISVLPSVILSMCKDYDGLHPTESQEYTIEYNGQRAIEKVGLSTAFLSYTRSIDLSEVLVTLSWLQGIVTGYYETIQEPIGLLSPFHEKGRIFNDSIASAVEKGRQLQLCPHHIWAIAASLPGREFNLPALVPGKNVSIPGHKEHNSCTFDFCEESVKNSTVVVQMHECKDASKCSKITFRQDLLHQHASQGNPTAWKLDKSSLLEEGQPFMAISHIWADGTGAGQGTRGVNECLYEFFCQLAEKFMCQGMWWDTICIPTDPKWRGTIMNNVHVNYAKAEVTLVHDLYLRSHEWAGAESASFAILMSSWFTRGWTALELARSKRVKILFKSGVVKDLDQDILAKPGEPCSSHRQVATTVIRNLRKEITDLNGLLTSLSPRYTSWQRDKAIIAALLTRVDDDEITQRTVQRIYQSILVKIGTISDGHLFHSSATMSRGFSWCPTSLLEMPLAEGSPSPLRISKNGDVVGYWKVAEVRNDLPVQYVWKDIHPLTIIMLQLALRHASSHLLLVESKAAVVTRALLVKVMKWPHDTSIPTEVRCKFIGPVYFQDMGGNETVGQIEIVIGDTEGMVEVEHETALEYAHRIWEERRKWDDYATGSIELALDRMHT